MTPDNCSGALGFGFCHSPLSKKTSILYENFALFENTNVFTFSLPISENDPRLQKIGFIGKEIVLALSQNSEIESIKIWRYGINVTFKEDNRFRMSQKSDRAINTITDCLKQIRF